MKRIEIVNLLNVERLVICDSYSCWLEKHIEKLFGTCYNYCKKMTGGNNVTANEFREYAYERTIDGMYGYCWIYRNRQMFNMLHFCMYRMTTA